MPRVRMTSDQLQFFQNVVGDPQGVSSLGANLAVVDMTTLQFNVFMGLIKQKPHGMGSLADYQNWLMDQQQEARGFVQPFGITDAPIKIDPEPPADLKDILKELMNQREPREPLLRAASVTSSGQQLDWSAHGTMTRLLIRNKGSNSAWMAFDVDGAQVVASTSDLSWELQAQEALSLELCIFQKVGLKCSGGQTATVHAIAFPATSGDLAGAVS